MERLPPLIGASVPGLSLRGIDVLVRPATKKFRSSHLTASILPLADASVDAVMFVDVLHHTDRPDGPVARGEPCCAPADTDQRPHDEWSPWPTRRCASWIGWATPSMEWHCRIIIGRSGAGARQSRALGMVITRWDSQASVYPFPASLVFERRLHFIAALAPNHNETHS